MRSLACLLVISTWSLGALAQEPPAGQPVMGRGDGFAAPNGPLGAGLSISGKGTGRAYGELTFFTQGDSQSLGGASYEYQLTVLGFLLGGGYKITPELELELMLPFAFASYSQSLEVLGQTQEDSDSGLGVGNLHAGVNWLRAQDRLKLKVGGALEVGPWYNDYDVAPAFGLAGAASARGAQDLGLWSSEVLSLVTPARIEYGEVPVFTGDGSLGLHIPTDGGDVELVVILAPGIGYYVSDMVLVGFRLPMVFIPTNSSDMAQLGAEPNVRFDFGRGFVNARFTLNLDEPLGFSFDEGKIWGLHVGGGGTF